MELSDICLRLTDDAIIPRCRILTGLSPVDEAKARQTLGERFERIRICEYVSGVKNSDGEFVFTDVMGEEKTVPGKLSSIDLIKNEIIIED